MTNETETAMNQIKEAKGKIEAIKKDLIANCGFKEGDCVEFEKNGKTIRGRVANVWVSEVSKDFELSVKISLPETRNIGWTSSEFFPDIKSLRKIPEPEFNEERISELSGELRSAEKQIEALTIKKRELEKEIRNQYKDCLHVWGTFCDTGETRKHFIGETEEKEAFCDICGVRGLNC